MQDVEKTEIQSQTSPKRRRRRNRMRPLYGLLVAALVIGVGVFPFNESVFHCDY